jgi:hypothetical protein
MRRKKWFGIARKLVGFSILVLWLGFIIWLATPVATLSSLEQVDKYPLYTVRYYGPYQRAASVADFVGRFIGPLASPLVASRSHALDAPAWACSLFVASGDADGELYGRNFDWQYSPAVLVFTDPPDGYASVSMVDIAYFGFERTRVGTLADASLVERAPLLFLPFLPFDGMNEHGLAVGMAAVPAGGMRPDPSKETISSLMIIRQVLDHAKDVDEALAIFETHNVDMAGGPPIHYLIADVSGRSVLVEFYQGEMKVVPNDEPWHVATNFLRSSVEGSAQGECWRYDKIEQRLAETEGQLTWQAAMDLLEAVSQSVTQWSIVYHMSTGDVNVAMGRHYDDVHTLHLNLTEE